MRRGAGQRVTVRVRDVMATHRAHAAEPLHAASERWKAGMRQTGVYSLMTKRLSWVKSAGA